MKRDTCGDGLRHLWTGSDEPLMCGKCGARRNWPLAKQPCPMHAIHATKTRSYGHGIGGRNRAKREVFVSRGRR